MSTLSPDSSESLQAFLSQIRGLRHSQKCMEAAVPASGSSEQELKERSASSLARFLSEMRPLTNDGFESLRSFLVTFEEFSLHAPPPLNLQEAVSIPNTSAFADFCGALRSRYISSLKAGEFIDFWTVAGMRRDEVRHASALAWFLNPNEAHGFGPGIFHAWVAQLPFLDQAGFSTETWDCTYRVATEVWPSTDGRNRVDIEIDSEKFLLFIEVKIDAPEGDHQIERYFEAVQSKARSRPFALIYLTCERPKQAMTARPEMLATSWSWFSQAVRRGRGGAPKDPNSFPEILLEQFLRRVETM